jgi:DNA helicase HerA-like ATPase
MSGAEHLVAEVQIMGCSEASKSTEADIELMPLNYPVKPANKVLYPDSDVLNNLLSGSKEVDKPIRVGSLINRDKVEIFFKGEALCSRHLAVLAQTGGGKTVACRTIIAGLAKYGHPMIVFDPHGDYLGLSKNIEALKDISKNKNLNVKLVTPKLLASPEKVGDAISEIVRKLGMGMTEAQIGVFENFVKDTDIFDKEETDLLKHLRKLRDKINQNRDTGDATSKRSINPILRKIDIIIKKLVKMESTNFKLRGMFQKKGLKFEDMANSELEPDQFISQNQITVLYLGGYERVVQSTMVSIILEDLFEDRSSMRTGRIPAFTAVIEEAHNFVPSKSEEKSESPSLLTIRRLLTEGRKFGTSVIMVSQRPGRLDETTLSQCNTFLVLKLVNPNDQRWVRNVMEQMSEQDSKWLKAFGKGQGYVSGNAVKFPLQVQIDYEKRLEWSELGTEKFIQDNLDEWNSGGKEAKEKAEQDSKNLAERVSKL